MQVKQAGGDHIQASVDGAEVIDAAVGGLELLVGHPQRFEDGLIGSIHALGCRFRLDLRFGQLHLIGGGFLHDGVVLFHHAAHVLLVSLGFCLLLPGLGVGPQGGGTALNAVGLCVDQVGQLRDGIGQQQQGVVILPLGLVRLQAGGLQLFQLGDVRVRHLRCGKGRLGGSVELGLYLANGFGGGVGRFGQFSHRNIGLVVSAGQRDGHASQGADRRHAQGNGAKGGGGGGGKSGRCSRCNLLHGHIARNCRRCSAHDAHKSGDALDEFRVFLHEIGRLHQQVGADAVGFPQGGGVQFAVDHRQVVGGVGHHSLLAFGGSVTLVGLVGQRDIFLPGRVGRADGTTHHVRRKAEALQHIGLVDPGQAEVSQGQDGALALLIQPAQAGNEGGQSGNRVVLPCIGEFLGSHAAEFRVFFQRLAAVGDSLFDAAQRLGHGGAAGLGLDAYRGHGRGKRQNLGLTQTGQGAGGCKPGRHPSDIGFRRSKVVAQIDDDRTQPVVVAGRCARDVGELCQGRGRFFRSQVGGLAHVDHGLGEAGHVAGGDAELAGGFGHRCNLGGGGGHLGAHRHDLIRNGRKLLVGAVHRLVHAGDGALILDGGVRRILESAGDLGESLPNAGRDNHIVEVDHRIGGALPKGLGRIGRIFLLLPELPDLGLQALAFLPEIVGVHPGVGQGCLQLVEGGGLVVQLCSGLFNLGGLGGKAVLQGGRKAFRLLDFSLDVVVLGLQQLQPFTGGLGGGLLLLVGADVCLGTFQLLDLFLGRLNGGLGRLEGPAEPAAHLRAERKQQFILFAVCHGTLLFLLAGFCGQLIVHLDPLHQSGQRFGQPVIHRCRIGAGQDQTLPSQPPAAVAGHCSDFSKKDRALLLIRLKS